MIIKFFLHLRITSTHSGGASSTLRNTLDIHAEEGASHSLSIQSAKMMLWEPANFKCIVSSEHLELEINLFKFIDMTIGL